MNTKNDLLSSDDGKERLRRMDDSRMAVLETQMQQVIKNQDDGRREALAWRAAFSEKFDRAIEVITNRPCVKHEEKLKSIDRLGGALWSLVLVLIPVVATATFFIISMRADIDHIKNTSYGYRGIKVVTDERP